MYIATKQDIFKRYKYEYWKASKGRKTEILNAVCNVTGLHRKAVVRKFHHLQIRDPRIPPKKRGKAVYYGKDVDAAVHLLWETANYVCGELLHPLVSDYVSILIRDNMWHFSDETTGKVHAMRKRTMRRRTEAFARKERHGTGRSATRSSGIKTSIPIFKGPWEGLPVGTGQIDTVAHCGHTLSGDFVYTLDYTDTAVYWVILRAQWNKGGEATKESLAYVRKTLPVPLIHIHPDSGTEFLNSTLIAWCDEHTITMTRSEPYKKNDNHLVEERNNHVVRKYMGYERLDCRCIVPLVNEYYDVVCTYLNHFQANKRMVRKVRVGSKIVKTYEDVPKTPYQRIRERNDVSDEVKERLRNEHLTLNPLVLKRKIDTLRQNIIRFNRDCGNRT